MSSGTVMRMRAPARPAHYAASGVYQVVVVNDDDTGSVPMTYANYVVILTRRRLRDGAG
jgi:hypothetical protein